MNAACVLEIKGVSCGTVLSLGTDAHAVDEITRGWNEGKKLLYELGDPPLYSFENMVPKIVRECSTK